MAMTLQQILHFRNLTGIVQGVKGGVPDLLPAGFSARGRGLPGQTAEWNQVDGTRETAQLVHFGSPAVRRGLKGVTPRTAKMIHTFHDIVHPAATLLQLQSMEDATKQQMGKETLLFQSQQFRAIFDNLRISCRYSALALGKIYFDGSGNLLPTSSGAVITVDFGVPAGNTGGLDVFGAGNLISASWATDTTNIPKDITNIKEAGMKKTGYPIMHCFYGKNIPSYLAVNDYVTPILTNPANGALAAALANGEIANGTMGLQWHPVGSAFFADSAGTIQSWFGDDAIVFTPDPSPEWFENFEGTAAVPTAIGIAGDDLVSAAANVAEVGGQFSYAKVTDNPVGLQQFFGDTFLPALKVPGAIFIGDATP